MNNKITFPRLATMLADASGRSKRFSEDFLREFFTLISEQLEAGDSVKIKGFGTFRLSRVEPRKSVDVTTGQPMEISGHSKVVFIPAKELADAINAPFEAFTAVEIDDDIDLDQMDLDESVTMPAESEMPETVEEANNEEETEPIAIAMEESSDITLGKIDESEESDYKESEEEVTVMNDSEEAIEAPEEPEEEVYSVENTEESADSDERLVPEEDSDEEVDSDKEVDSDQEEYSDKEDDTDEVEVSDEEKGHDEDIDSDEDEEAEDAGDACAIGGPVSYNTEEKVNIRKNWTKGFFMGMLACLAIIVVGVGVAACFIWPDQINSEIKSIISNNNKVVEEEIEVAAVSQPDIIQKDSSAISDENHGDGEEMQAAPETDKAGVAAAEEVPTAPSDAIVYDTISKTRYLTTMAKAHYGNYNLWPIIYEENKAKLGHPDRIRPGTPVVIPKLDKYGVDPFNKKDVEKIKNMGIEIYGRYGKKI